MREVRTVPAMLTGHPDESISALAATLGYHTQEQLYTFETSIRHLTPDQIRGITRLVADRPFSLSAQSVYQRALLDLAAAPPAS